MSLSCLFPHALTCNSYDIFKFNRRCADKQVKTKTDMTLQRGGKEENSVRHSFYVRLIPLPTSFLILLTLHAVSIYSSMKGSDRRVICMIAFSIPCINSAGGMNS